MYLDDNVRGLTKNVTPSSNEEEEHIEKGEKTNDEEKQDIEAQQGQRGKGEMGQVVETKTEVQTIAQTP